MAVMSALWDIKSLIEYHAGVQTVGRPVVVHGVTEYHSNCPFCGGVDRFIMKPDEGTYTCQIRTSGCGVWGDALGFLRDYCSMTFREACEELGVEPEELEFSRAATTHTPINGPPAKAWRDRGEEVVAKAQAYLRAAIGKDARAYLRSRGLSDDTILEKRLGYIPLASNGRWQSDTPDRWGFDAEQAGKDQIWLPEGVIIPWYVGKQLWKLDVRRLRGLGKETPKILSITGSSDTLYNWASVSTARPVAVVESALCAIVGEQEAEGVATFVATGGAGKYKPSWARHVEQAPFVLVAHDDDKPDEQGIRAGDAGARAWLDTLSNALRWLPSRKDVNDMLVAGDSVADWVTDGIDFYHELQGIRDLPVIEIGLSFEAPSVAPPPTPVSSECTLLEEAVSDEDPITGDPLSSPPSACADCRIPIEAEDREFFSALDGSAAYCSRCRDVTTGFRHSHPSVPLRELRAECSALYRQMTHEYPPTACGPFYASLTLGSRDGLEQALAGMRRLLGVVEDESTHLTYAERRGRDLAGFVAVPSPAQIAQGEKPRALPAAFPSWGWSEAGGFGQIGIHGTQAVHLDKTGSSLRE